MDVYETRDRIVIRRPIAPEPEIAAAPSFTVDRPLKGLRVGLRDDAAWRSWSMIVGRWAEWLRRDGAEPVILISGQRTGREGEKTRADLDLWANSVDCAVVGLAN
jgi:hypothetical protein